MKNNRLLFLLICVSICASILLTSCNRKLTEDKDSSSSMSSSYKYTTPDDSNINTEVNNSLEYDDDDLYKDNTDELLNFDEGKAYIDNKTIILELSETDRENKAWYYDIDLKKFDIEKDDYFENSDEEEEDDGITTYTHVWKIKPKEKGTYTLYFSMLEKSIGKYDNNATSYGNVIFTVTIDENMNIKFS